MAALLAYLPAAGHDQLWLLYVATHILHGEKLYGPTLLESNPPLIVWLSLLPAWIAQLLSIESSTVGKALVLALQAGIASLSLRLLRLQGRVLSPTQRAALLFVFLVVFNVLPARDLGQRDYLLALLTLPYVLATASNATRADLPSTLLAVLGFALKPQQALVPLVLETYLLLQTRSLRPLRRAAPWAFLLGAALYFLLIQTLTPAYLTHVLPLLRETYWAFGHRTLPQLLLDALELHLLLAAVLLLYVRSRTRTPQATSLLLASLAATCGYYLQGTGWYYQQLPALTFSSLALAELLLQQIPAWQIRTPHWLPRATLALGLLAVALTTHFMGYPFTRERSFAIESPDPSFFRNLPEGSAVMTVTTTVDDVVMPAERWHLTIAQRYPHYWMLPALLRNEDGTAPPAHRLTSPQLQQLAATQRRYFLEDLEHFHPALLLINRCEAPEIHCQVLEDRHDNLLNWLEQDPAIRAALTQYEPLGNNGAYAGFRLRPPSALPPR
ncbi:MAG: hypothetical protein PW735_02045 [Acidobacteriaceae bacterium]|nr:hypothetical protein [Acidobacteriaceae bacterium]